MGGGANGADGSTGESGGAVGASQFEAPAGTTSRIGLAHGDAYTYESVTEDRRDGIVFWSNRVVYTQTINNPKSDLSFEKIVTNTFDKLGGLKSSIFVSKTGAYESTEDRAFKCTIKNGQYGPGHRPYVGQTWKATMETTCSDTIVTSSTLITEMDVKVTAKETITLPVGNITAFRVESRRDNWTVGHENQRAAINYVCWYDEISSQLVACEAKDRYNTDNGPVESISKSYLIGIDAKNHPVKTNSALRFLGNWEIVFSDKSTCLIAATEIKNSSNVQLKGACGNYAQQIGILTGTVSPNGEVNAVINGEHSPFTGNFTSFEGSGSAIYGRGTQTWSAKLVQL